MEKYFISIPDVGEGFNEYIGPDFCAQLLLIVLDDGTAELGIKLMDDANDGLPTTCVVFRNDSKQKCYITETEFNEVAEGYKRVFLNCFDVFERLCDDYMDTKSHNYPLGQLLLRMANWLIGFDEDGWRNPFE